MVFWMNTVDYNKKRKLLAFLIFVLTSAWMPVSREIFLGLMNRVIYAGITVGLLVSILAVLGAMGLWSKDWHY